jgi:hypothetical protein
MTLLPPQSDVRPKLLVRDSAPVSSGTIRSFWATIGIRTHEALKVSKDQSIRDKFGAAADTSQRQPMPILNSPVYWQGKISGEMQYLFGAEEGVLREIRLTANPSEGMWTHWIAGQIWAAVCVALLIPIAVLLSVRWVHGMELWLQFPQFWGMTLGVLLWTFLPNSFLGLFVMLLVFASMFRPSWSRHRLGAK